MVDTTKNDITPVKKSVINVPSETDVLAKEGSNKYNIPSIEKSMMR